MEEIRIMGGYVMTIDNTENSNYSDNVVVYGEVTLRAQGGC